MAPVDCKGFAVGLKWNVSCSTCGMRRTIPLALIVTALVVPGPIHAAPAQQPPEAAQPPKGGNVGPAGASLDEVAERMLSIQVALDRAGFSPGEIDGAAGDNTSRALRAFQERHGLAVTGEPDAATMARLGDGVNSPVQRYTITAEDAEGPFVPAIPADMMEKAQLPSLGYTSLLELLAERFHASPKLLQRLNPRAAFASGEEIVVPNVEAFHLPAAKAAEPNAPDVARGKSADQAPAPAGDAARAGGVKPAASNATNVVIVTDKTKTLTVENAAGETIFFAPVTVGSENDPLPVGEWKVNGVSFNPTFNYNPDLFWDADPSHAKAKIPAGPNNPVGVVWIDLSKEHYGIHGTPEPARIGYTESHGCIRLSNWNAARVAGLVAPGTKVVLR